VKARVVAAAAAAAAAPVHIHEFSQKQREKLFEQPAAINPVLRNIVIAQKPYLKPFSSRLC
jgi:hypothetical protein